MEIGNNLLPLCLVLVLILVVVLIIVIFMYRKLNVIEQWFNHKPMNPKERERAEENMTNNILKYIPFQFSKPHLEKESMAVPESSKLPLVAEEPEKTISEDEESGDSETE